MKNIKIGNGSKTFVADHANTHYTMAADKKIDSDTYGLDILGSAANRSFEIDGKIDAVNSAVRIGMKDADAAPVEFTLGESGRIVTTARGIEAFGQDHLISNEGIIDAGSDGIAAHGSQTLINSGSISATYGVNFYMSDAETSVLRNSGTIEGSVIAVYGSVGSEKIVNSGSIKGEVELADGDDVFILKAGTLDDVVRGGGGNDVFVAKVGGLNIVEDYGKGTDTVRAAVDYTLQANVEKLHLIGKKDIDGIGTGGDNELIGNAGKNHLSGGYGFDSLNGGRGNDILEGGVGADDFYFEKGTGRDTIFDYEAGYDDILINLQGVTDFADMIAHHATEKNGSVQITYGDDTIVFKSKTIADLQSADFDFG